MARKTTVPAFLPILPANRTISHDVPSRDFLLAKRTCRFMSAQCNRNNLTWRGAVPMGFASTASVISGERAAYQAPDFAQKISRTRSVLLKDIAAKHV